MSKRKKKRKMKRPSPQMIRERENLETVKYVSEALGVTRRTARRELTIAANEQGGACPVNIYDGYVELIPREQALEVNQARMALYDLADAMKKDDPKRADFYDLARRLKEEGITS